MILEGNTRAHGQELAHHLMNLADNDHVYLHGLDGFVAQDLFGAFAEAEAISQATQCQKYLFSLSLNPPAAASVPVEVFEDAIARVEKALGLSGQPRAVVFHEKNGRRHAHCVWSRIDAGVLKAVPLPHFKRKLTALAREIYLAQDWDMPAGFRDAAERDSNNFSRAEAGQAKAAARDPKALKAMFRQCWATSDSRAAFAAALHDQGFLLARGDRRGFVAVGGEGKVWSLSRWCGVRPGEMRARLGSEEDLPALEDALAQIGGLRPPTKLRPDPGVDAQRRELIARQRLERAELLAALTRRRVEDMRARLPTGLRATFLRMTGRFRAEVKRCEAATKAAQQRDRAEQQRLIDTHLAERRELDQSRQKLGLRTPFHRQAGDPCQRLELRSDEAGPSADQLRKNPAQILAHLSKTRARFTRTDVLRGLAAHIDDPLELGRLADTALSGPEAACLETGFTTRDFQAAEARLASSAKALSKRGEFGVSGAHIRHAMQKQDAKMQHAFGGRLSQEQRDALKRVLGDKGLASVVGLAGAGKSTMLATAMDAWARQGITVHGAALAGKAADGLQDASGIPSRTLASLEMSWKNGYAPIGRGDVLVVDEAGMIGTRQMDRVAAKMREIGAKLVLVGDPEQLQPIEAGTPFRDLVADHPAARLTEIHRQREDWQRAASGDLAEGRLAEAVSAYADHGALRPATTRDEAIEALAETYAMDAAAKGADTTRLALAHRRRDVHALNQAIREALRPADQPRAEVLLHTETGPRAFAPGDRLVFGRNDRELGVKNGMLGDVMAVSHEKMTVALDGDAPRQVTFDPRSYRHIDHGYAVTIHKSQGATVDQAYVLGSRTLDCHLTYVAMTRHRDTLSVFASDDDRPRWARNNPEPSRSHARARDGPSMG